MPKAYVLVVRHPDYENAITTDGDVKVIDIDLGASFTIRPEDAEDALEWVESNIPVWLADVPPTSPVFTDAIEAAGAAVEEYEEASDWLDAYVAERESSS